MQGCPRTVLSCPSWDPLDIKSPQLARMSHDSPGMSLMGSFGDQVTPACKGVPGKSWDVPHGVCWTSSHTSLQGCPRVFLDIPLSILQRSSYHNLQACPRTVLGCPSWDPPEIKSPQLASMSQDSPWMSLMGSSRHQVTPAWKDVPGQSQISLLQSSRHQVTPICKDVPGQSWDVWYLGLSKDVLDTCRQHWT